MRLFLRLFYALHTGTRSHFPVLIHTRVKNKLPPSRFRSQRSRLMRDVSPTPATTLSAEACATASNRLIYIAHRFYSRGFCSRARCTHARPLLFEIDAAATAADTLAIFRTTRRPARPHAPLHTPRILQSLDTFPSD
ncbi:hypothetical protein BJY52DRAFT_299393 [Lactarius psammicola]|nr:hypothetical protein BJY52DRAFT_299393 [Lactarius psammicola]